MTALSRGAGAPTRCSWSTAGRPDRGARPARLPAAGPGRPRRRALLRLGELRLRSPGSAAGARAGAGRGGGGARRRRSRASACRRPRSRRRCIFEHVYFARPDSTVFGDSVSQARLRMGAQLAREAPAAADIVVPVPDSGLFAALGYSRESGLPLEFGLIRNHYVGRTFIEPKQSIRNFGVKIKLNPVRELIAGKRVVLVDDSIVRGTTSQQDRAHGARGRRRRGARADLGAADAVALPLRHRHPDPRRADRRQPRRRRRSASSSRPTASATSRSTACSPPSPARTTATAPPAGPATTASPSPPKTSGRPSCSRSGRRGSEPRRSPMQLGMVGLGRMGGKMVRRLLAGGHECVVWDRDACGGRGARGRGGASGRGRWRSWWRSWRRRGRSG